MSRRRARAYGLLLVLHMTSLYCGLVVATGFMLALMIAGFWEIASGVRMFFSSATHAVGQAGSHAGAAIEIAIRGLEFLFLAPLPYFLILGVLRYVEAVTPVAEIDPKQVAARLKLQQRARVDLLLVKSFGVALFIAVMAASLVGETLSRSGLTYEKALCGALVILVLGSYFFMLEHTADKLRPLVGSRNETEAADDPGHNHAT